MIEAAGLEIDAGRDAVQHRSSSSHTLPFHHTEGLYLLSHCSAFKSWIIFPQYNLGFGSTQGKHLPFDVFGSAAELQIPAGHSLLSPQGGVVLLLLHG